MKVKFPAFLLLGVILSSVSSFAYTAEELQGKSETELQAIHEEQKKKLGPEDACLKKCTGTITERVACASMCQEGTPIWQ